MTSSLIFNKLCLFHFCISIVMFVIFFPPYWHSWVWYASIKIFKLCYVTRSLFLSCTPHLWCAHICRWLCAPVCRFCVIPTEVTINYSINYLFSYKWLLLWQWLTPNETKASPMWDSQKCLDFWLHAEFRISLIVSCAVRFWASYINICYLRLGYG